MRKLKLQLLRRSINVLCKSKGIGCGASTRCISTTPPRLIVPEPTLKSGSTSNKTLKHTAKVTPLDHHDYFNVRELVTLDEMFEYFCHYGHDEGCRNVFMSPYIFGTRYKTDIIDLEKSVPLFQDALNFLAHIVYRQGVVLFISRQKLTMPFVESMAENCGEYAHCRYWTPGLFTNTVRTFNFPTRLPDLCVFLHTQNSAFQTHKGIVDSAKLLIPSIGIVDTNSDPRLITYPIPGNDDSITSVMYYLQVFEETVRRAKEKRIHDQMELEN